MPTRPRVRTRLLFCAAAVVLTAALPVMYIWHTYGALERTAAAIYEPIAPVEQREQPGGSLTPEAMHERQEIEASSDEQIKQNEQSEQIKQNEQKMLAAESDAFTLLLLGVDERERDRGRTDVLLVISVNLKAQSALLLSIPRDTLTLIHGRQIEDKINHAYAFGGVEATLRTVEHFLDFPIDYYVKVNMEGFSSIVDRLGGVNVDNAFAFDYEGYHFGKGKLEINGEEALAFVRMRYDDPNGDFGRNSRQRDVLLQLMRKLLRPSGLLKLDGILEDIRSYVRTNVAFTEMKTRLAKLDADAFKVETVRVQGQGVTRHGIWYYQVTEQQRMQLHERLKTH